MRKFLEQIRARYAVAKAARNIRRGGGGVPTAPVNYRAAKTKKNVEALYKYTKGWNKNIRELSGEFGNVPKGNRTNRARKYKRNIEKEFQRQNFGVALYRGLTGKNRNYFTDATVVKKPSFSSFSKSKSEARGFADNYRFNNYYVLVLNKPKNLPSINFKNYKTRYEHEQEVLIPQGVFTVKNTAQNGKTKYLYVNFKSTLRRKAPRIKYQALVK